MKKRNEKYDDIVKLYPNFPTKKIAEITGKPIATIRTVAVANKLHKKKYYWTKKEDAYLLKNYKELGAQHCANHLKRNYFGVVGRWRKIKKE